MRTEHWWCHLRWGHVAGWSGVVLIFVALIILGQVKERSPRVTEAPCPSAGSLLPVDVLPQAIGVPLVGPLEGQKKPPCKLPGERGLKEYELRGACWYRVEGTPPCGEGYDYGEHCYAPVPARFRMPNAVEKEGRP